jgi:hypothetical protein
MGDIVKSVGHQQHTTSIPQALFKVTKWSWAGFVLIREVRW